MKLLYIITPSSNIVDEKNINKEIEIQISKSENLLKEINIEILYGNLFSKSYFWYAGNIQDRLKELHEGFKNDSIDFIISSQGGYNVNELLKFIDYKLIKKNKKPLIGLSDITVLLNAIFKKTGVVTYHGFDFIRQIGKSSTDRTKNTLNNFFNKGIFENEVEGVIINKNSLNGIGILIGGCLPSYSLILGTEYDPIELNKKFIFFIEDIGENYERIISYIQQLLNNEKFIKNCNGFIIGNFSFCDYENNKTYDINEIIKYKLKELDIPILKINNIGHVVENPILPIGQEVEISNNLLIIKNGIK